MGAEKKFPRSDDAIEQSLTKTKQKHNAVPVGTSVLSTANAAFLLSILPLFITKRAAVDNAYEDYHNASQAVTVSGKLLKSMASAGFQLLGLKVKNNFTGYPTSTFTLYKMSLSGKLPIMGSEAQILQGGNDFIGGEVSRIAAGGTALVDISKSNVETLRDDYIDKQTVRNLALDAAVKAQQLLKKYREEVVDPLIVNLWSDITRATQGMTPGAAHDFETSWGMIYGPGTGKGSVMVMVINASEGELPLGGASLRVGAPKAKAGAKATTNAMGIAIIESSNFEPTFVNVEMPGFVKQSVAVTIIEDEEITLTVRMVRTPR